MPDPIRILIAGDFCPRSASPARDPFADNLRELFKKADYTIVNLEAPLTDAGKPILKTGRNFRISPQYAETLKQAGIDCVTLANNHIRDFGDEGVLDTIKNCKNAGLDFVGAGADSLEAAQPLIKEIRGRKIAILNYCEREFSIAGKHHAGANPWDLIDAYRQISMIRPVVDKIIVIYHGGIEYVPYPTPEMVKTFRFLADIGADSVLAHHSHAYSGYEIYNDKAIYYGLGNLFSFTHTANPKQTWLNGLLAVVGFDQLGQTLAVHPERMDTSQTTVDLSTGADKLSILNVINVMNKLIADRDRLEAAWNEYDRKWSKSFYRMMLSRGKSHSRVIKYLRCAHVNPNKFQRQTWLNCFRCESLRHRAIRVLLQKNQ